MKLTRTYNAWKTIYVFLTYAYLSIDKIINIFIFSRTIQNETTAYRRWNWWQMEAGSIKVSSFQQVHVCDFVSTLDTRAFSTSHRQFKVPLRWGNTHFVAKQRSYYNNVKTWFFTPMHQTLSIGGHSLNQSWLSIMLETFFLFLKW